MSKEPTSYERKLLCKLYVILLHETLRTTNSKLPLSSWMYIIGQRSLEKPKRKKEVEIYNEELVINEINQGDNTGSKHKLFLQIFRGFCFHLNVLPYKKLLKKFRTMIYLPPFLDEKFDVKIQMQFSQKMIGVNILFSINLIQRSINNVHILNKL